MQLLSLINNELSGDDFTQFEVDQLAWKVFSKIDREEAKRLLDKDIDLFKRSMSVASSYTLCAFILGYYSDEFLSKIFNETFLSNVDLKSTVSLNVLKNQLEKIRLQESLKNEDNELLKEIYLLDKNEKII